MGDEDKLFEFMTKMYSEMQTGFKSVNTRLDNVEGEISDIKADVQKIGAKIDGELIPKQQALFDGYKQNTEAIYALSNKVDYLQTDVNNLTIRTLKNENNIINMSRR